MKRPRAWKSGVAGLTIVLLGARIGRADDAPSYPLNTLTFMSSDVVRGTIAGPYDNGDADSEAAAVVRVDAVYAGKLKVGANIKVEGLLGYEKSREGAKLEKGDQVWLFLETPSMARGVPEKGGSPEARAADEGKWVPVLSGVWLAAGGKAVSPKQFSNPGRYEFSLPADGKSPTVEEFSRKVDQAVNESIGIRARLAKPVDNENQSWALRMLQARGAEDLGLWDPLVHTLLLRLGQSHDLSLAQEAVEDPKLPMAEMAFAFASPEGRELLLKKLAEPKLSAEIKLRYLEAVRLTGPLYGMVSRLDFPRLNATWVSEGKDVPSNGKYLQRLAEVVKSQGLQALTEKVQGWSLSVGAGAAEKFPEAAKDDVKAQEIMR